LCRIVCIHINGGLRVFFQPVREREPAVFEPRSVQRRKAAPVRSPILRRQLHSPQSSVGVVGVVIGVGSKESSSDPPVL
jgi:hypothetical protein